MVFRIAGGWWGADRWGWGWWYWGWWFWGGCGWGWGWWMGNNIDIAEDEVYWYCGR